MILPLRRRHRLTIYGLGVLVPLGFVAGLLARSPSASVERLPGVIESAPLAKGAPAAAILWKRESFAGLPIAATLRSAVSGDLVLRLAPARDLRRPDVLAYWTDSAAKPERVPDDAVLLGRLHGTEVRELVLPSGAAPPGAEKGASGAILLYSLGHQEVIGVETLRAGGE